MSAWGEQFAELPEAEPLDLSKLETPAAGGYLIPASLVRQFLEDVERGILEGSPLSPGATPVGLLRLPGKQEENMKIEDPEGRVALAFNRWLEDYERNPSKFEHTVATVKRHLEEKAAGKPLSYGDNCVGILNHYLEHEELGEAVEAAG